jgi:hypothetical protein
MIIEMRVTKILICAVVILLNVPTRSNARISCLSVGETIVADQNEYRKLYNSSNRKQPMLKSVFLEKKVRGRVSKYIRTSPGLDYIGIEYTIDTKTELGYSGNTSAIWRDRKILNTPQTSNLPIVRLDQKTLGWANNRSLVQLIQGDYGKFTAIDVSQGSGTTCRVRQVFGARNDEPY